MSVSVLKVWEDNDDQDGIRPEEIKVQLYADGTADGEPVSLNEDNGWSYTWIELPEKKDGEAIVYDVAEVSVPDGYKVVKTGDAVKGYVLTNSHDVEKTEVKGIKTWKDAENQDGLRPASITVNLLANGKEIKDVTVTQAENWEYIFDNLDKYLGGEEIVYTVTEDKVENYTSSVEGYDITNIHEPAETEVSVTKIWVDDNNLDQTRPESIEVQLYADGEEEGEAVELNDSNSWSYTWTELPKNSDGQEIDYTVEEVGNVKGYTTAAPVEKEDDTFTITNTRDRGNLEVEKTVDGNSADEEKEFQFTVTLDNTNISGEFGDMTFKDGVATFALAHNEKAVAQGLPTGISYTVTENADGYTATSTGETGTIDKNETDKAVFENVYNTYGDLTVSKSVAGNAASTEKAFEFTVTLDHKISGTYGDMTFEDGVAAFTLKADESKEAKGLPNGIKYTVAEKDYTSEEYVTTYKGITGTIIGGGQKFAEFVNTRNAAGSLSISKTVAGNDGDSDKAFTFMITLDADVDGEYSGVAFEDGAASITLKDGESKTIEGLPNGASYTVVEKEADTDGYVTTYSGNTSGTISEDAAAVVAFTNTRDTFGNLEVSKSVEGNDADTTKEFGFRVTLSDDSINGNYKDMNFVDGVAEFTLKHGEKAAAEGLPNGITYEVEEMDAADYVVEAEGKTGTITDEEIAEAVFINTRNTYGDLEVSKSVAGNDADTEKEFGFKVTLSDLTIHGVHGDMEFEDGVAEFTLKHGEKAVAEDLPNGITYEVEEIDAADYVVEAEGETGTIDDEVVAKAAFINNRDTFGNLNVTKTVKGNDADKTKEFGFKVTLDAEVNGTYGDMTFAGGVAEFTLTDGEIATATGLPNGIGYTVEETNSADYVITSRGENGTIDDEVSATAAFINTRDTYGDLTVTKSVAGNDADTGKEFTFTVTLSDAKLAGVYGDMTFENGIATVVLKGGESATAAGLPNGMGYSVLEADYSEDGYVVTYDGKTGAIDDETPKTVTVTNTRNTYGNLEVTKTVAGNAADELKTFSFTVTLDAENINDTYGDMTFVNGVAQFELKHGEKAVATGLPNGIAYTVTEADYSEEGYVANYDGETGIIDDEVLAEAAFINSRDTFGDLIVTKTVAGNAPSTDKEFEFTVSLDDETITGVYGEMEFVNGEATFTLKADESKKAEKLPNGMGYTVTEADYTEEGYLVSYTGETGVIVGDGQKTAAFVNTRNADGSLTITKTLEGNDVDPDKEFTFTITMDDDTIEGTYSDERRRKQSDRRSAEWCRLYRNRGRLQRRWLCSILHRRDRNHQ